MKKNIYINGRQGKLECILFEPDERNAGKGSFLFLPGVPGTDQYRDLGFFTPALTSAANSSCRY